MNYIKGDFTIIPNLCRLVMLPPEMQVIFLWLCVHADKDGICFPTRKTLSREAGVSISTFDKYVKELEKVGFIKKTKRKKPLSKENTSNIYQIMILEDALESQGGSVGDMLGGVNDDPRGGLRDSTETISSINYNHLTNSETSSQEDLSEKQMKKDIDSLIEKFQTLNESVAYGNKTQRAACQKLIEKHGLEKIIKIVETVLPRTNARPRYEFPYVDTPHLLWTNWTKIGNGIAMQKQQLQEKKPKVHRR